MDASSQQAGTSPTGYRSAAEGDSPEEPPASSWRRLVTSPLTLAVSYAAFGLAWIVLSDRMLQSAASDVATLGAVGQGKGVAFVLATSGLIYVVASRRRHDAEATGAGSLGGPRALLWVFALLSAIVVLASLVSFASSAHKSHEQQIAHLRREAGLRAEIVQGWIERRNDEAGQIASSALLRETLTRWRRNPDEAMATQLRKQLLLLLASTRYADALLLDEHANLLLAPEGSSRRIDTAMADMARSALQRGLVQNTDFYAQAGEGAALQFDVFIPISGLDGRPEAVLMLRTAPRRVLLRQLLAGADEGGPQTLLVHAGAEGLAVVGVGGSVALQRWPRGASKASLQALADNPALAGSLLEGLAGTEAMAAVAAPIRDSGWYVAVQTPSNALQGQAVAGATTLAIVNVLAVLAAGAMVYAALQRRELQNSARATADHHEKERAWKITEVIANCSADLIFAKDLQGRYLFANREMCKALGRSPEQIVGLDSRDIFPPEQVRRLMEDDAAVWRSDKPVRVEERLTTTDGDRTYVCTKGRLVDGDGCTLGLYGVFADVTERRSLQQRMRQWATAFEDIRDGVIITDAVGRIQSVNRAFSTITGYSAQEAVGATLKLLKSGRHGPDFYLQMWSALGETGHWQGEIWNRRRNGDIYPEWLTVSAVRDEEGLVTHYVGVFTDISRLKHSEAQTDWLAHHDPLTRLPNRTRLQQRLEAVLERSCRREARAALLVIDLDGFKTVNDSLGHPSGDELLVCVAQRLQARLRQDDFLGRLGGDEFLVILESAADVDGVAALAGDLLAAVSAPVALSCGQDAYLTASIGISMFPDDGCPTAVELLRDADAALYRAKELGRNRSCFYTGDMNVQAMAKLDLEAALSRAIERGELLLHYQPKVDGHSGLIVGAEALLRWNRHGIGLVPPGEFIPQAEDSSLILAIGNWVIDAACRQIQAWMREGRPVVRIAVNVAARQFAAGDLDTVVARALERYCVPAHYLELELTEGMLISQPQAGTQMLQRLRSLGVKVSLDDFGTGYSSLAYLQQLPIDALKIDQSFVRRIGDVPDGEALVDAVIGLAHRLHLRVVAEGVETTAQRDHLLAQRCDEMQGYHFGRPDTADALQRRLASNEPAALAM